MSLFPGFCRFLSLTCSQSTCQLSKLLAPVGSLDCRHHNMVPRPCFHLYFPCVPVCPKPAPSPETQLRGHTPPQVTSARPHFTRPFFHGTLLPARRSM